MNNDLDQDIPDFINQKLAPEALARFEAAMASDKSLQSLVAKERALQSVMRNSIEPSFPQFSSFEGKIRKRNLWQSPALIAVTATLALLAITVPMTISYDDPDKNLLPDSVFETKSKISTVIGANVLRIVTKNEIHIEDLISEYQLKLLKAYPGAHTLDVEASALNVETISRLKSDARIQMVQHITSNHP